MPNPLNRSIIQIADYGAPYPGNFIASLLALRESLNEKGLRQVLVLPKRVGNREWFKEIGHEPLYLLDTNLSYLRLAYQIANIATREKAILIHTHFTTFDIPAYLSSVIRKNKLLNNRVIWHIHSNFPVKQTVMRKIKNFIKWDIIGNHNITAICASEEIADTIIHKGFYGQSYIVNNCIDIKRATKKTLTRSGLRANLRIPENIPLLLAFGWSPYVKGIDILIKAVEELQNKSNFVLLIIGGDLLNEFIHRKYNNRLPSNIIIRPPDINVGNLYNAADVFISSSRAEGCPYSVMEAMANGLPIIASNIEALKWGYGVKGIYFFKSCDVLDLKQKILEVLNFNLIHRSEIAKINSEFIKKHFSIDIWVNNIVRIYENVLY